MARYEDDPSMRDVAFTTLLARCNWFGDLKMADSGTVVTEFLRDWRDAQYRHDTGGGNIRRWATTWSEANRGKYAKQYPYLAPVGAE